jgi:hypothetical protein
MSHPEVLLLLLKRQCHKNVNSFLSNMSHFVFLLPFFILPSHIPGTWLLNEIEQKSLPRALFLGNPSWDRVGTVKVIGITRILGDQKLCMVKQPGKHSQCGSGEILSLMLRVICFLTTERLSLKFTKHMNNLWKWSFVGLTERRIPYLGQQKRTKTVHMGWYDRLQPGLRRNKSLASEVSTRISAFWQFV